MSSKKPFEYKMEVIYSKKTVDVMMIAWVTALQSKMPLNTIKCIKDFFNYFNINEDDYSLDSAAVICNTMRKALDEWDNNNRNKKKQDY